MQPSKLKLAKTLWLLAIFGFTHALSEWGYIFVPMEKATGEKSFIASIVVHLIFMALSFSFLFYFGLVQFTRKLPLLLVPIVIFMIWYFYFVYYYHQNNLEEWYINAEIWARYLLGFPGPILAGLGFWKQRAELKAWGPQIDKYLKNVVMIFLIYGFTAGFIVPAGKMFPSNIINKENFLFLFHIPIFYIRAGLSILLTWYIIRTLTVFKLEFEKNFERVKEIETLFNERRRIANDIHDGVIQTIYGSGLLLDSASELIETDKKHSKELIKQAIARLNESIISLRRYIHYLKSEDLGKNEIEEHFYEVIQQFRETFPEININSEINIPMWFVLIPRAVEHVKFILQEAIANSARHSSCSKIDVKFFGDDQQFYCQIKDNGTGIKENADIAKQELFGHGMTSMKQRAESLRSSLEIKSSSMGTVISLIVKRVVISE